MFCTLSAHWHTTLIPHHTDHHRFTWLRANEHGLDRDAIEYDACWLGPDRLADAALLKQCVFKDLEISGFTLQDLQQHTVVINCRSEGHCDLVLRPLTDLMQKIPVQNLLVLYSTVMDVSRLPYPAVISPAWMVTPHEWINRYGWPDPVPEVVHKFICLMRRPSPSRARLAQRLIDQKLDVLLSFGTGAAWPDELPLWRPFFSDSVALPITVDDTSQFSSIDFHPELFMSCAVNIIAESSSQDHDNSWYGIFITEKTGKCFYQRQLPLWWAVPGLVQAVRDLGFDVFDDVIDHSYDLETDADLRLDQLMQQIEILDSMDLSSLRRELWPRVQNNFELLVNLYNTPGPIWQDILKSANFAPQSLITT